MALSLRRGRPLLTDPRRTGPGRCWLPWLALPGSTIPLIAVSIVIAAGCLIAGRANGAVLAVIAVPVTAFLDDRVLKHLIDRTHFGQLSFPSGHTASAMTLATVLGVLLHDPTRRAASPSPSS
jgi:membrane-associated phospholipid phosphatase